METNTIQTLQPGRTGLEIAVIGMSGRFPGADDIGQFWENLKNGIESTAFFSDEELVQSGSDPGLLTNPRYVKARGVMAGVEYFDAAFFGYTPPEAAVMDPQLRVGLECSWHALEEAGYDPDRYEGSIGFYAGGASNLAWEVQPFLEEKSTLSGQFGKMHLLDKDFMALRTVYALNLKGPAVSLFTACSTSLAAVDMACRGLLTGQCEMALAGGVGISLPVKRGYIYEEGMLMSPDGHVRAFDAQARGTNGGDGVGMVVLKPLESALADQDHIHAVIKGSEMNNDGTRKVGFQAPSVEGQAEVIRATLHIAEVEPESIGYIETHGTGTPLGDPIEFEALVNAFATDKKQFCKIGSVKTNVGHLDSAAGIAGFIKTVLVLKHQQIPPSLHFKTPNPRIDFANSPFGVSTSLTEWKRGRYPRRAGVSSFGIGGTNVHVILEEAPEDLAPPVRSREYHLFLLSARTAGGLERMTGNFLTYLKQEPAGAADIAYTLQMGRKRFEHRRMLVGRGIDEAAAQLENPAAGKVHSAVCKETARPVVFMLAGQGSQYTGIGRRLYETEPRFRENMDRCFDILTPLLGQEAREILYPPDGQRGEILRQDHVQPLVTAFEYSLAQMLIHWGIEPAALIGYSLGEYAAACLSGVFSPRDALSLLVYRGREMMKLPAGAMLSVPLPATQLEPQLGPSLSLAIDNGESGVISGPPTAVDDFEARAREMKLICQRVTNTHAMHSAMVESLMAPYRLRLQQVERHKPRIPFISNLTGKWITPGEAVDPGYWVDQMRYTVRFSQGLKELLREPGAVFIEIGPGNDLSILLKQHLDPQAPHQVFNTIRNPGQEIDDVAYLLNRLGRMWLQGVTIDWKAFYGEEGRRRVSLPVYPFEKEVYPVEVSVSREFFTRGKPAAYAAAPLGPPTGNRVQPPGKREDISQWLYIPGWKISVPGTLAGNTAFPGSAGDDRSADGVLPQYKILVLGDKNPMVSATAAELARRGHTVIQVAAGSGFSKQGPAEYTIDPVSADDCKSLVEALRSQDLFPQRVVHLWGLTEAAGPLMGRECHPLTNFSKTDAKKINSGLNPEGFIDSEVPSLMGMRSPLFIENGKRLFLNLLYLAAALGTPPLPRSVPPLEIAVVTSHMQGVYGDDLFHPGKALLLGPVRTIPREYPHLACRSIDITLPGTEGPLPPGTVTRLCDELLASAVDPVVVFRGIHRMIPSYDPLVVEGPTRVPPRLKPGGVYWIIGGLGGIGLEIAQYLANTVRARLILTGRSLFPTRDLWERWLEEHAVDPADPVSGKIRRMKEWEQAGAEVLVYSADVGDKPQMKTVLHQAEQRYGPIQGIIHSAGIIQGSLIAQTTPGHMERAFKSKVDGIRVLEELMTEHPEAFRLDFMFLSSSLNALAGIMGEVTYTAANAFLDAYALYKTSRDRIPTVSVNWDAWQGVGFALEVEKRLETQLKNKGDAAKVMFKHGMFPAEGITVFKRILGMEICRAVVSTMEIKAKFGPLDIFKEIRPMKDQGVRHPRPDLGIPYAPPVTTTEHQLCETWERFLGMEKVGVHDNFFELGVSSLGILQVTGIINDTLSKEIPPLTLYGYPTVHELARYLDQGEPGTAPGTGEPFQAEPPGLSGLPGPLETPGLPGNPGLPGPGKNKLRQRKNRVEGGDFE